MDSEIENEMANEIKSKIEYSNPVPPMSATSEQVGIKGDSKSYVANEPHRIIERDDWQGFDQVPLQPVDNNHYTQVLSESLLFGTLVFIAASLGLILSGELNLGLLVITLTGLILLLCTIGYLRYRHAKSLAYATCEHEFLMQKGFWWVKRTSLPYSRLQHVSISHGPLERHFNLSTIKCFSAGSGSAEIELPGIDQRTAEHLRQHLLAQAANAHTSADVRSDIQSQADASAPTIKTLESHNDDA
ncbi:PH domain-containing protein [Shewanella schlegeliana]|uniref:PH domain-containing protein n=1 Tax=Shewanella schlegeliana TaxID=190308 RepID=A0ABS1T0U8_9GAMM|nr:PH domain-containing protein [Shewanella schlegeliana]MBL4914413.1 PH domain-containing protein [Shewanella schlegeliana]MCL1109363.1 PH domain-containing protein [Shewanella schlegeliana]GIU31762.1 hypothetical protein TUM4433_23820 [Shewanella schlegeliana]